MLHKTRKVGYDFLFVFMIFGLVGNVGIQTGPLCENMTLCTTPEIRNGFGRPKLA